MKTEIEKRASKIIDETDMMQFSTMEIMVMFAEKELEAINYTHSCTELPSKQKSCVNGIDSDTCRHNSVCDYC